MPQIVRLLSGSMSETEITEVSESVIEKPVMLVYEGKFMSMDGEVEIKREHIETLATNHNGLLAKFARMATGEIPLKDCPPIQLDHSVSARDTVGRLVGNLSIGDYEDDGAKKKALFGRLRVMGKENVEKVRDGRWTHVSIGADLEAGKLTELSITPFPAAPNASMLRSALSIRQDQVQWYIQKWFDKMGNAPLTQVRSWIPDNLTDEEKEAVYQGIKKKMQSARMAKKKMPAGWSGDQVVKELTDIGCSIIKGVGGFAVYDDASDEPGQYLFDTKEEAIAWAKKTYMSAVSLAKFEAIDDMGEVQVTVDAPSPEAAVAAVREMMKNDSSLRTLQVVRSRTGTRYKLSEANLAMRSVYKEKYQGETLEVVLKDGRFYFKVEGLLNGELQGPIGGGSEGEMVRKAKEAARDMIDDVEGL